MRIASARAVQTALRTEIRAVLRVLEIANENDARVYIICDNEAMVDVAEALMRGSAGEADEDLWMRTCAAITKTHRKQA